MASLRFDKLFHVLVVLGAASCSEDGTTPRDRNPVDAAAENSDGAVQDGMPCLCETQACCDRSGSTPVLQEGFTCCWSTTCE